MKILIALLFISQIELEPIEAPPGESAPVEMEREVNAEPSSSEPERPAQKSLSQLDQEILLLRLKRLYGEFGRKSSSEWKVDVQGESLLWTWSDGQWNCESKAKAEITQEGEVGIEMSSRPRVDCSKFRPVSLRWWETSGNWIEPVARVEKRGFLLDQTDKQSSKSLDSGVFGNLLDQESFDAIFGTEPEDVDVQADDEDEPFRLGGKRIALEEWSWTRSSGEQFKVYTSLRNHWIERIDQGNQTEYIVSKRANKWSPPRVQKIILEKDGQRLTFEKQSKK